MRILHINCNYIGTTLHQLMVEKLEELGHKNTVFVPTYDRTRAVITPNSNVIVSECFKKWDRVLFDYKQSRIFAAVQKAVDVPGFDLIHAYTLFTDGNCAMRLSQKYGVPYVVAVRNTDVNSFLRLRPHLRGRGVEIMRRAKAVFFLSEPYRAQVFETCVPEKYRAEIAKKTYVIPNGIDDFWLKNVPAIQKRQPEKEIRLIYAGRIDKNKNIPTTQKAVRLLRAAGYDATLTVVGKVEDRKEFAQISKDPYTVCLPACPKERLMELYREHDVFVMPSFTESFGLVYAEAMSQGLPVIYSKGQGFDGQFPEGTMGFHVESRSAEGIAQAVRQICERYESFSRAALQSAGKFCWDEIACAYDSVYQKEMTKNGAFLT